MSGIGDRPFWARSGPRQGIVRGRGEILAEGGGGDRRVVLCREELLPLWPVVEVLPGGDQLAGVGEAAGEPGLKPGPEGDERGICTGILARAVARLSEALPQDEQLVGGVIPGLRLADVLMA